MQINTSRFGTIRIEPDDVIRFPNGLVGLESCRHWVLLADMDNSSVGWLQCVAHPDQALAVISPRRFAPEYKVHVDRRQMSTLDLSEDDHAYVLAIVAVNDDRLTANLKAPLLINLDRRTGCQVVTTDDQPVQLDIGYVSMPLRKSA